VEYLLQQIVNGVTLGSIYGLIAIGYTMVYGIIGMINFAHGDVFMVSAFIALAFILMLGLTGASSLAVLLLCLILVLIIAMVLTAAWGWALERFAYRPLRGSFRLAPLITAIGMSVALQNFAQLTQGARTKPLEPLLLGGFSYPFNPVDGQFVINVSYLQIIIVVTTVLLMVGFTILINRTALGRAQRACEQDRKMAALLGVDVDRTIALTFIMGASLAAVAGLLFLLYYGVIDFYIGFLAGIKAFTAAVLGGIGSLPGAMLGGLAIGLIETLWSGYFSVEYKDVAAFSVLAVVLIFMPSGLLGKPEIEKV
jgi:branched-chain amino acid transport system permease protein